MLKFVFRLIVRLIALPFRWLARILDGITSGPALVLDLEIEQDPSSIERQKMLDVLRGASGDDRVVGVLLRIRTPLGGWATAQDLGTVIHELREAGKPVYAYVEQAGNGTAWLAAQCTRAFILPTGEVSLVGMGAEMMFYGAALKKLGVEPDFEAAGEYKSFGEAYLRSFPSGANQEATQRLLESLHAQLVDGVAVGRKIPEDQVSAAMRKGPMSAQDALDCGLVDQLAYEDQLEDWIEEQHGDKASLVPFGRWSFWYRLRRWLRGLGDGRKFIGVLHLEGPIVMETSNSPQYVNARKVVSLIRRLKEMKQLAALVVNVNSPGGSAVASDIMWREIDLLRREKTVVAVFDDVAASGGYYLAAPCAEIVARKGTLTGSIGVFGGKLVLGGGLGKLGVHSHAFESEPHANFFSATRKFSDQQRVCFRASLQRFYDGFVQRVAAGRRRPVKEVEVHCRGRVWTGADAIERGLVDHLGDLELGIERARVLAGVHAGDFKRMDIPVERRRLFMKKLRGRLGPLGELVSPIPRTLVEGLPGVQPLIQFLGVVRQNEAQPLAMLPFHLDVK